ncbi:PREDICTED: uncharacterized protein LOC105312676 isoform X2 [Amphimedon queenslandica]|uniref:Uncharacterized protein n=1 Tax=Amphimedon queenslandica TaxID=400682 RepID=A0AAN0J5I9_AMPQE|nr:PREDICTED: uncharacterized protein LOC105312676 isoform X2 [Amphimedon queenslandica]|eukprot:XP_019852012.1 PREDICTED: uncharacterized protein LOC105312676 isoform X2 [Amphimedon queenslandica]
MSYDKQPLMGAPPPYQYQPPPPQRPYQPPPAQPYHAAPQTTNNTVIVTTQPTRPAVVYNRHTSGDHFLTLSIFLTICCFFWGTWCALACTIPAIVFAINARDADARGDQAAVERNRRLALFLNIGGIATYAVSIVIFIIVIATSVSQINNCYYSYYYYQYIYYC